MLSKFEQHSPHTEHDEVKTAFVFDHQSHEKFLVGPGYNHRTNFWIFFSTSWFYCTYSKSVRINVLFFLYISFSLPDLFPKIG